MKEKKSLLSFGGDKKQRGRFLSFAIVIIAYIAVEILMKTGNLNSLFTSLLVPITCYVVAAIGLNLNVASARSAAYVCRECWQLPSLRGSPG